MSQEVMATQQFHSALSAPLISSGIRHRRCSVIAAPSRQNSVLFPSNLKLISSGLIKFPGIGWRCNSSEDSGENEFRTVLDAFFLGKAVGEALTERIESSVGEFLSVIGRFQAEQQKQVLQFQEEVLEKARRAKKQASREAMETQGLVSKSTSSGVSADEGVGETVSSVTGSATSAVEGVAGPAASVTDSVISVGSSVMPKSSPKDPFVGLFDKD